MKRYLIMFLIMLTVTGCSNKAEEVSLELESPAIETPTPTPKPTPSPTPTPVPAEDLSNKAINTLTGYYIDKEIATRRPIAVVFNNFKAAVPQSGISQADLVYEVISESDITRIIGVFKDFDSDKIGSIRSARHYFLDFALDNDAIFTHFGGSDQAFAAIKTLKIDNLNGIAFDGTTFWRDKNRIAQAGYEHSAYTSYENLMALTEKLSCRMQIKDDFPGMFGFYDEVTVAKDGQAVNKIIVPYASTFKGTFEYDAIKHVYKKSQFNGPQIDEQTGEQLSVTNIIIQKAKINLIPGDTAGRRDVQLVGSGSGYLLSEGVCVPIKWSKADHYTPTVWKYENGEQIKLNKGKTWISVISDTTEPEFVE